ncbi:MAG TPA: hypothetical protein VLF94_02860 [Chlamydiales bacterium]|nr:hypothetical protein [Chlamydiales bacterium]
MKTILTEQQTAFFTKNGYIEFEVPHLLPIKREGRDLWRQEPKLQHFLIRTLGPIALALTGKKQLHLAVDQWFPTSLQPEKAAPLKDLFSIQGFALGAVWAESVSIPVRKSPLGILPLPTKRENILFFRPNLILDWPHVETDVYLVLFALPHSVYVHNPKDPQTNYLKPYGYQYGDVLKNEFHPLIH